MSGMKILIKNNSMFGGYIAYISNKNNVPISLPEPFNVSATRFTNKDKNILIFNCKMEAFEVFSMLNLTIDDISI